MLVIVNLALALALSIYLYEHCSFCADPFFFIATHY